MLLRASGQKENRDYDLTAVTHGERRSGVEQEDWLKRLTEEAIRGEWTALARTLDAASHAIGRETAVDCLVVASAFNGITRVADATGIPLDENTEAATKQMRAAVGLDAFAYAAKSARFD
jgi:hypothetical protein